MTEGKKKERKELATILKYNIQLLLYTSAHSHRNYLESKFYVHLNCLQLPVMGYWLMDSK